MGIVFTKVGSFEGCLPAILTLLAFHEQSTVHFPEKDLVYRRPFSNDKTPRQEPACLTGSQQDCTDGRGR